MIGVRFKEQRNFLENPTAWQILWQSVQAMQQVGNQPSDKITKYPNYIEIAIDVQGFNSLDFNLAREEIEVMVIYQLLEALAQAKTPEELGWPPGFFEQTAGSLQDDPIVRYPQGRESLPQ